ncbi:3-methyladenine DNA glycosylase [Candidatus Peregrinibacteria bacterium CG10_big_fil_rev_8_21_14_0_10_55_24]|nr:MAG: 3-methyladenine DNA glycosylase [Candidatus Peregrinibacteria bacterium CG10_big_fil_rev_8_21_14_0_10_55_24]
MARVLPRAFFARPVLTVAEELLGKELVRQTEQGIASGTIAEVEAYDGPQDLACHAARGRTPRTEVMYGLAGHWYVYFVYGMHWMLNVVTGEKGYPAAVLIRTVGEWDGPGKLTRALSIDCGFHGAEAMRKTGLWIEDRGVHISREHIERTERIGVAYAKKWAAKPYRFVIHEGF